LDAFCDLCKFQQNAKWLMILTVLSNLIPIFLIIAVGWLTRVTAFVSPDQWNGFERVTYQILIPALILTTLAMADLKHLPLASIGAALLAPVLVLAGLLLALRPMLARHLGVDGPAFTSVLQGAIRWNSFIALALALQIHGKEGGAVAAVGFAVLIPAVNLISAYALARFGATPSSPGIGALLLTLLKNPFVWSTLAGIFINLIGLPIPKPIASFGDILGRAALAAGLLLVGSGLDLATLKRPTRGLLLALGLRQLAMPLITGLLGLGLGLGAVPLSVCVICAAVPTAAASYVMARQSGGDAPLMASIITAEAILSAVTLPLMLIVFAG
jgi:malonate transporter and related proteins